MPINYGNTGTVSPGVAYSDDRGETWKVGGICRIGQLSVESRAVELVDGSLLFNGRTNQRGRVRVMSILPDGGTGGDSQRFWDAKDLPMANCQGTMVRYSWPNDGKPGLILFSGLGDPAGGGSIFGSYDDGKTWTGTGLFYEGPTVYRDIAMLDDGRLIALFEKDGKDDLGFVVAPAPPAEPPERPKTKPTAAAVARAAASAAAKAAKRVVGVAVSADSEHPGLEAVKAMDGNPETFWCSIWRGDVTVLPHELVVDLGEPRTITGFTYLPRTDNSKNGNIKDYEVYLSDNPDESKPLAEGTSIAKGTFENEVGESVVLFEAPVKGRYFRLRALSNINGEPSWAVIGELTLHCEGVKFLAE